MVLIYNPIQNCDKVRDMTALFRWLAGLFGLGKRRGRTHEQDDASTSNDRPHLPGESARFKDIGLTPQEQAWERARKVDESPSRKGVGKGSSELDRLLRKK